jgi:hypothetical protein
MSRFLANVGLATVLATLLAAPAARAITADEIITQHVAALGGADKLKAIRTLKRSGHLLIPGLSIKLPWTEVRVRPTSIRQEVTLQGLTQVAAFDGHDAWQVQPFQGRKDPARMSADEAKGLRLAADIDMPLVDYKAKGHTVEYLGLEDVDGTPAHKLRVRLAWGDEVTYWIDPDSWMVIRDLQRQTIRGAEQVTETDYGEYERVAGVWIAMTEESGPKDSDSSQKQKFVYEKGEANIAVDAATFAFPATSKPAGESHP